MAQDHIVDDDSTVDFADVVRGAGLSIARFRAITGLSRQRWYTLRRHGVRHMEPYEAICALCAELGRHTDLDEALDRLGWPEPRRETEDW